MHVLMWVVENAAYAAIAYAGVVISRKAVAKSSIPLLLPGFLLIVLGASAVFLSLTLGVVTLVAAHCGVPL